MKIKVKKLNENAVIPSKAHASDAGYDLTATSKSFDDDGNVVYGIGLAISIPSGYVGLLFPRSSNAKKDLILSNSIGVLDSGYIGEVMFKFKPCNVVKHMYATVSTLASREYLHKRDCEEILEEIKNEDTEFNHYEVGDRIGQLIVIPIPSYEFELVDDLGSSERGSGGYGSSGA